MSNFAPDFLNMITVMQKAGIFLNRITVLQTKKVIPTGSKPTGLPSCSLCSRFHLHGQMTNPIWLTGKVIPANTKVNKTNPKSIGLTPNPACGISFAQANGKLCFECLKTFSVPENYLPLSLHAVGKNALRSRRFFDRKFSKFKIR
jgi:hypothetical protein